MPEIFTQIRAMFGDAQASLDLQYKKVKQYLGLVRIADGERFHQQRKLEQLEAELAQYGTPPMPGGRYNLTINKRLAGNLPSLVPFIDALVIQKIASTVGFADMHDVIYYLIALVFSILMLKFEVRAILSHLQRQMQGANAMQAADPITFRNVWSYPALWATMIALPVIGVVSSIFALIFESGMYGGITAWNVFVAHILLSATLFLLHFLIVVYYDESLRAKVIVAAYKSHTQQEIAVEKSGARFMEVLQRQLIPEANNYLDLFQRHSQRGRTVSLHAFDNDLIGYLNASAEYLKVARNESQQMGIPPEDVPYKDIVRRYRQYVQEAERLHQGVGSGSVAQQRSHTRPGGSGAGGQRPHPNGASDANHTSPPANGQEGEDIRQDQETYNATEFFAGERDV